MPPKKGLTRARAPRPKLDLPPPELLPQIVIVGRPNVGKSSLFNRLVGGREAIVHETRGVTRDRLTRSALWLDTPFAVTDQAGWDPEEAAPYAPEMRAQIDTSLEEADVIWFVVDRQTGITTEDRRLAAKIKPLIGALPIFLVVNKSDDPLHETDAAEFYALGLGEPYPVSATHGRGVGDLLDASLPALQEAAGDRPERALPEGVIPFVFLGRQNAGKSTLFNALVGSARTIVSDIAGTTRDAIDAPFTWKGQEFLSIDTAGMKQKGKVEGDLDFYSTRRAEQALGRAEIAVLVLDVSFGVTETDQKIAGLIEEAGRGCVIVANKWDLSEGDSKHRVAFEKHVRKQLHFLLHAPVVFTSGLTGKGKEELLITLVKAHKAFHFRIPTAQLNAMIGAIQEHNPPQSWRGRTGKIYYAAQIATAPPKIVLQVNTPRLFTKGYKRYILKALYDQLPLDGAPIILTMRGKKEQQEEK